MEDVFFPVRKVPISELGVSLPAPSGSDHAIIADGQKKEILTFCSEDYGLIPNYTIKKAFDEILSDNGLRWDFTASAFRKSVFRLEYTILNAKDSIAGDIVAPRLFIYNSYNRRVKFQFGAGIMRLICTNGLTVWDEETLFKVIHSPSVEGVGAVPRCIPLINSVLEGWDNLMEPFEELSTIRVPNVEARLSDIIQQADYPRFLEEVAFNRIIEEMRILDLKVPTDWIIYNGLNYGLVHESSLIGKKSDEIDRRVLSYMLQ